MVKDITDILKKTESKIIRHAIAAGSIVLGVKTEGKAGVLVRDEKFSDNMQSAISKKTGIPGYVSTDELPHYGINLKEKKAIEKSFGCKKKDNVVFVAGEKSKAEKAVGIIEELMAGKAARKTVPAKKAAKPVKKSVKKKSPAAKKQKLKPKKKKK